MPSSARLDADADANAGDDKKVSNARRDDFTHTFLILGRFGAAN